MHANRPVPYRLSAAEHESSDSCRSRLLDRLHAGSYDARRVDRGLVVLALRRTLSLGVVTGFVVLASLLGTREWAAGVTRLEGAEFERGLARGGVWLGLFVVVLVVVLGRAAGLVGRWRAGEADWLAPRAISRTGAALSSWAGVTLGGVVLLAVTAFAAELAAGGAPTSFASMGSLEGRDVERLSEGRVVRFVVDDPRAPTGSRFELELGLRLDSGVSSDVALRARRVGDAQHAEARARIGAATARVELDVPPGVGAVAVELERLGEGALLVLAPRVRVWAPVTSEAMASLRLFVIASLALASLAALVLGLAAWTRPAIGAALVATAVLAVTLSGQDATAFAPGSALPEAFTVVQTGRVPAGAGVAEWLGALGVAAVGLGLAARGQSPWRRGA